MGAKDPSMAFPAESLAPGGRDDYTGDRLKQIW
jgi:hypothetical protein